MQLKTHLTNAYKTTNSRKEIYYFCDGQTQQFHFMLMWKVAHDDEAAADVDADEFQSLGLKLRLANAAKWLSRAKQTETRNS